MNKIIIPCETVGKYHYIGLGILLIVTFLIVNSENVFGALSAEIPVSTTGRVVADGFGFNDQFDTPTGTVASSGNLYMAYQQRTDPFVVFVNANHELIFQKSVGATVGSPVLLATTTGDKTQDWKDIATFVDGTTVDVLATKEVCFDPDPPCTVRALGDLLHFRSTDDGVTFGSGNLITALVEIQTGADSTGRWWDVDGNNISVFYDDAIAGTGNGLVFKKSSNGGTTFGSLVIIDPDDGTVAVAGSQRTLVMEQSSDGTKIWVMYIGTDPVNGDKDVFYSRSIDSGATFSTPIIVSTGGLEGGNQNYLKVNRDDVTLFFTSETGSGLETFSQVRSSNSGLSFSAQEDIFLGTTCDWDLTGTDDQHITQTLSGIYTMCIGINDIDVFVAKSSDMGATWGSLVSVTDDPNFLASGDVMIEAVGNNVYVTWVGEDDQSPFDEHNAFVSSLNGGGSFSSEQQINVTPLFPQGQPHIRGIGNDMWFGLHNSVTKDVVFRFETFFPPANNTPVTTLTGDLQIVLQLNDTYTELGATCLDVEDGSLVVTIGGDTIITITPAVFTVTYNCLDLFGTSALQITRSVVILGVTPTPPAPTPTPLTIITGGGGSPVSLTPEIEGITPEQQLAFDQAVADAIASIEPSEGNIVETIIQTFFEFIVVDKVHEELQLQSFLDNERLGFRWSTGDDLIIVSATPALSPFMFTFEQFPVVRVGSGAFVSTNFILYNLEIPRNECSAIITIDCVEKIRYEIPVTVNAIINGTQVSDTGTITVDLTEDRIDPILLIILSTLSIPIIGVIIQRSRGRSSVQSVRRLIS